jgi:Flp pilus assembly protein TadG
MLNAKAWSKKLRKFQKNEGGSVLILFGLTVILLFLFAGCGMDYARARNAHTRAGVAIDAATLAAAKAMREQPNMSDAQLLLLAQQYFDANISRGGNGATTWEPVSFSPAPDRKTGTIHAKVSGIVQTFFARVAGPNLATIPVSKNSVVTYNLVEVEIGLVLDVTGSMNQKNKIGDMKSAVKTLADIMLPTSGPKNAKIGLAPYSASANLGTYASAASNGRSKDGCVVERLDPMYRYTDIAPVMAPFGVKGDMTTNSGSYACNPAKLQPLTDDHDKIVNTVNTYSPGGCTAGHIGAMWGWNLISPNWSNVWPAAPAPYNDGKTIKAVILMTDGTFNTQYVGAPTNCNPNGDPTAAAEALKVCDAMKAQGVVVYTVGFRLSTEPPSATTTLAACASSASHALLAENGAELDTAFKNIAIQLNNIRLSQ